MGAMARRASLFLSSLYSGAEPSAEGNMPYLGQSPWATRPRVRRLGLAVGRRLGLRKLRLGHEPQKVSLVPFCVWQQLSA